MQGSEDSWAAAMKEAESPADRDPALWAKRFAESEGDEQRAKAACMRAKVAGSTPPSAAAALALVGLGSARAGDRHRGPHANPPNLSPLPLVSHMRMRLDMARRSGLRSTRHAAHQAPCQQRNGLGNRLLQPLQATPQKHKRTRQPALHHNRRIGPIAHPILGLQMLFSLRRPTHQCCQVVRQHLGRHIHQQRLLRQPRDTLELEAVL